jgi:peptidoglycan/LPS O-acetylase OafA/YrhL
VTPSVPPAQHRLAFLDVLRGIAALSVAFAHVARDTMPGFAAFDHDVVRIGQAGVVVFFLCSGFIIPASLERHGSLRAFWIGRFFRLVPLYWTALAAALLLASVGLYRLPGGFLDAPVSSTLSNLTMMQAFLGDPLAIKLSWTLAFELAFYLMVSGMFLARVHRRSVPLAVLLLSLSLAAALVDAGRSGTLSTLALVPAAVAGAGALIGLRPQRLVLAVVVAVLAVPLLRSNDYYLPWFSFTLFAAMFSGTAVHRWLHGDLPGRVAALVLTGAAAVSGLACRLAAHEPSFLPSFLLAYGVFGAALLLRHRRFPRPLVRLGVISYSVYLVHPLVGAMADRTLASSWMVRLPTLVGVLVASVLVAGQTHRFIEQPMIRFGRRVAARYTTAPAPAPEPWRGALGPSSASALEGSATR